MKFQKMYFGVPSVLAAITVGASALAAPTPLVFDNTGFSPVDSNTAFNGRTLENVVYSFFVNLLTDFTGQISGTNSGFGFGSEVQEVELFMAGGPSYLFNDLGGNFFNVTGVTLLVGTWGLRVGQISDVLGGSFSGYALCGVGACSSSDLNHVPEPMSFLLVTMALGGLHLTSKRSKESSFFA